MYQILNSSFFKRELLDLVSQGTVDYMQPNSTNVKEISGRDSCRCSAAYMGITKRDKRVAVEYSVGRNMRRKYVGIVYVRVSSFIHKGGRVC
jgi:hypothetical protein